MSKYKATIMLVFISLICCINFVKGNNLELIGKVIYLDPGHGGVDPGAVYKNIEEATINLKIALKLKEKLQSYGAIVYMTRESDIDLSKNNSYNHKRSDLNNRIKAINDSNCDLFISLHLNSDTSSLWYGSQVFYDDVNSNNEEIAQIFQKMMKKYLNSRREYKEINNLYLLKNIKRPGVLIEMGFISNNNERYLLQKEFYQNKIVDTISKGIIEYFNK